MDKQVATRTCGQCNKEVAEVNFALHETHCSRFLCLCPDCDEAVPKEQLEKHREEQHTQVRCSKCNQKLERCQLLDHESDECVERLQTCQFCELELPWKHLDEHCRVCGSRTELCRDCGRYVRLSDQPAHTLTCSTTDNASSPPKTTNGPPDGTKLTVTCSRCTAPFPVEDIDDHERKCNLVSRGDNEEAQADEEEEDECDFSGWNPTPQLISAYKATSLSNRSCSRPWGNGRDPDQIRTCPYCHLALPLFTLRWHKVKCQRYSLLTQRAIPS
uniref:XIAP-associated factor 1 n=1 Tax=Monopterus albus TaxID=43700 RepID=UPI0009B34FA1|nr:XIAP-associated factor 1 [Monopterus albus]